MELLEQVEKYLSWKKGKTYICEKLGCSLQEVEEAINELRGKEEAETIIEVKNSYKEEIDYTKNTKIVTYSSEKPLSPKEIEELVGADGITTQVNRVWFKGSDGDTWKYSIEVKFLNSNFYNGQELKSKLQDLITKVLPKYKLSNVTNPSDKVLMVYISDDHCGLILKDSLYGNEQSETNYNSRLENLYQEILNLGQTFDKIYLVSLGDELDGWSGYTTRGGHSLGSLSNKEQFDMYFDGRRSFYDNLFNSGISNKYIILNQNNSNHSGKGFAYIANKALEVYIEAKYQEVYVIQNNKMIQTIEIGNHVFGFIHGKDETHQKSPFPLNLDARADNYLFEYYDKHGYSPSRNWISTIKGDIHKLNVNIGKHGRYVNVPSISSGSSWIEHNFGNSHAGALLEIVNPNSKNITSIPIWF